MSIFCLKHTLCLEKVFFNSKFIYIIHQSIRNVLLIQEKVTPSGADRLRITPADANLDPTDFVLVKVRDTENRPLAHVDVTLTDWKKEVFVAEGATDSSGSVLLEYESPGVAIWANANLGGWGMARAFVERSEGELAGAPPGEHPVGPERRPAR